MRQRRFDGTGLSRVYSHLARIAPAWRLGATGGRVHAVLGRAFGLYESAIAAEAYAPKLGSGRDSRQLFQGRLQFVRTPQSSCLALIR